MTQAGRAHAASYPRGQYEARSEDPTPTAFEAALVTSPEFGECLAPTIEAEQLLPTEVTCLVPGPPVVVGKRSITLPPDDWHRPPDLTSPASPRSSARLADPNRKRSSASRRLSTSCTPLSGGGVAAAASERRKSWIGLTRQLSDAKDQTGQPQVLTSTRAAASMERAREPAAGSDGLWLGPNAVHLLRWCLLLVVGINVLAFPFLLSFVGPVSRSTNHTWFAVLLACDAVLWLDVASRFVTPQWEGGDEGEETRLSHRRVASRYLLSWDGLLLDVLCRWPWDAFVAAAAGGRLAPNLAACSPGPTVTFALLAPRPRFDPYPPALASP